MGYHLSDQEQKQLVKDFWKNYGNAILLFVLVFVASNFFWRYFGAYHHARSEQASIAYMEFLSTTETHKDDEANMLAKHLVADYVRTPYASLAALFLANDAIKKNDLATAKIELDWVIKHGSDDSFRTIARIRKARILTEEKDFNRALTLISKIEDKAFLPLVDEVKGDIFLAQGNQKAAVESYKLAEKEANDDGVKSPLLSAKLRLLPQ